MNTRTRDEIIDALIENGTPRDHATMYADAYLEYRQALQHIATNGMIIKNPRTGMPTENPHLAIRDRAEKRLRSLRKIKADFLW